MAARFFGRPSNACAFLRVYAGMRPEWRLIPRLAACTSLLFLPLLSGLGQAAQSTQHRQPTPYSVHGAIPMPADRAQDSYAIYALLTPGPALASMPPEQSSQWAIAGVTVNETDRNPAVPPQGQLKPPSDNPKAFAEALFDYQTNKYVRVQLTRAPLHIDHGFALLSPDQVNDFRAAKTAPTVSSETRSAWSGFPGITYFSEVYFDSKHSVALVYRNDWCAHLCAAGSWIYLERQGNRWVQRSGIVVPGA